MDNFLKNPLKYLVYFKVFLFNFLLLIIIIVILIILIIFIIVQLIITYIIITISLISFKDLLFLIIQIMNDFFYVYEISFMLINLNLVN